MENTNTLVKRQYGSKTGPKARQYTDLDKQLIEANELSNVLIAEQTGTSVQIVASLRARLKNKEDKPTKRKYEKKVDKSEEEIAPEPKTNNKELNICVNGIQLQFSNPAKKIIFGKNSINIEL